MSNLNSMIDRLNKLNSAVERKPEQQAEKKSDATDASNSSKILKDFLSKNSLLVKNADSAAESKNDISAQKALSAFIGAPLSNNGKALIPGIITENPDKHKASEKHDPSKKPVQAFTAVTAAPTPSLCWKCEAALDGKAEHETNPAGKGNGHNGNGNGIGTSANSGNGTNANSTNTLGSTGSGSNGNGSGSGNTGTANGSNGSAGKTSSETWKPALLDTKSKPVPQPEPAQASETIPDTKPLSGNAKAVLQNAGNDSAANSKQAPSFLNAANVLGAVFKAASAAVSPGAKAAETSKSASEPQVKTPQPEKEFDAKENTKGTSSSSAPATSTSPTGSVQGGATAASQPASQPASQAPLPAFAWFKHTQTIESALRINDVHYADTVLSILFDVSTSLNADAGVKARLISLLARIRMDKKQYAEAETDLRNTLAVLDGTPHAKSISAAHCWHALAQSLYFQKKIENAEVAKEKAVAIAEACLGPQDPQTIAFKQALSS